MGASPSIVSFTEEPCPSEKEMRKGHEADQAISERYFSSVKDSASKLGSDEVDRSRIDLLPKYRMQAYRRDDPSWRAEVLVFNDDYYSINGLETLSIAMPSAYEGEWAPNGMPEGIGALLYSNGACYIGDIERGSPWGMGAFFPTVPENETGGVVECIIGNHRCGKLENNLLSITATSSGSVVARLRGSDVTATRQWCGDESDDCYWLNHDYNAAMGSLVEAAQKEEEEMDDTGHREQYSKESWGDIIPEGLLMPEWQPGRREVDRNTVEVCMSSTSSSSSSSSSSSQRLHLSGGSFRGVLHRPTGKESTNIRLLPLPSSPPRGTINVGAARIQMKRSAVWVNTLTRLCRLESEDGAEDLVKILGVCQATAGCFYLVTECFDDADGEPLKDIQRASSLISAESAKRKGLTEEEYNKMVIAGNSVNSDSDFGLIFTYRLAKALRCLHHAGVTYSGLLSFQDILIREGKDGLRITPTVRAVDYHLDTSSLLVGICSCLPPSASTFATEAVFSSPSAYRSWPPETIFRTVFGPALTSLLMGLFCPSQAIDQPGQNSDVWCLAAIAHFLTWSPVVAADSPLADDDDSVTVAVGQEGGNASFKNWEEPLERLSLAQWSALVAVLPKMRQSEGAAGRGILPALILAYDDGRRMKEQSERVKSIRNRGGEIRVSSSRKMKEGGGGGGGAGDVDANDLETSKDILEEIVRRVMQYGSDPDGRPSLASLTELIKTNMPAVDAASATLRKHYRPQPASGGSPHALGASAGSAPAKGNVYDENLKRVMDSTAATASRISSKLGESSSKFFTSFVGGISAAVSGGAQANARQGVISLGVPTEAAAPTPPPPPPPPSDGDSSVEAWMRELGKADQAESHPPPEHSTADIQSMVADTFAAVASLEGTDHSDRSPSACSSSSDDATPTALLTSPTRRRSSSRDARALLKDRDGIIDEARNGLSSAPEHLVEVSYPPDAAAISKVHSESALSVTRDAVIDNENAETERASTGPSELAVPILRTINMTVLTTGAEEALITSTDGNDNTSKGGGNGQLTAPSVDGTGMTCDENVILREDGGSERPDAPSDAQPRVNYLTGTDASDEIAASSDGASRQCQDVSDELLVIKGRTEAENIAGHTVRDDTSYYNMAQYNDSDECLVTGYDDETARLRSYMGGGGGGEGGMQAGAVDLVTKKGDSSPPHASEIPFAAAADGEKSANHEDVATRSINEANPVVEDTPTVEEISGVDGTDDEEVNELLAGDTAATDTLEDAPQIVRDELRVTQATDHGDTPECVPKVSVGAASMTDAVTQRENELLHSVDREGRISTELASDMMPTTSVDCIPTMPEAIDASPSPRAQAYPTTCIGGPLEEDTELAMSSQTSDVLSSMYFERDHLKSSDDDYEFTSRSDLLVEDANEEEGDAVKISIPESNISSGASISATSAHVASQQVSAIPLTLKATSEVATRPPEQSDATGEAVASKPYSFEVDDDMTSPAVHIDKGTSSASVKHQGGSSPVMLSSANVTDEVAHPKPINQEKLTGRTLVNGPGDSDTSAFEPRFRELTEVSAAEPHQAVAVNVAEQPLGLAGEGRRETDDDSRSNSSLVVPPPPPSAAASEEPVGDASRASGFSFWESLKSNKNVKAGGESMKTFFTNAAASIAAGKSRNTSSARPTVSKETVNLEFHKGDKLQQSSSSYRPPSVPTPWVTPPVRSIQEEQRPSQISDSRMPMSSPPPSDAFADIFGLFDHREDTDQQINEVNMKEAPSSSGGQKNSKSSVDYDDLLDLLG